jgi:hypothetical protein
MRLLAALIPVVVGLEIAEPSIAQVRAGDADQRGIELVVASSIALTVAGTATLGKWELDPRLYVIPIPLLRKGERRRDTAPAQLVSSHDEAHLRALVRALGAGGLVDDSRTCVVEGPDLCRLGEFAGVVSFSAAMINGDRGEIRVQFWSRIEDSSGAGLKARLAEQYAIFSCAKIPTGWRVVDVQRIVY